MKVFKLRGLVVIYAVIFFVNPASSSAGLYGDEAKNATTGELNDQDYWWTKFDMMMLDLAIKQHQPEGHIAVDLASTGRRLDDLAKKISQARGDPEMEGAGRRGAGQDRSRGRSGKIIRTGVPMG